MLESFVLLSVGFGESLNFSLLGISNVSVPPMTKKKPIAFAQLAIKAVLDPSEGVFSLQAQLTSESYIFSEDCKLTAILTREILSSLSEGITLTTKSHLIIRAYRV